MFENWMRPACLAALIIWAGGDAFAEASFWVKCDGFGGPEDASSRFARNLGNALNDGPFREPEVYEPTGRAAGLEGIAACDQALAATGSTPDTWLRRARLLEARAVHNVETDQDDEALADIEAARAAAVGEPEDIHFARSTGVSLDLLQSYLLLRRGDDVQAARLAASAAVARPYAPSIQHLALFLMGFDHRSLTEQGVVASRLDRIDPNTRADTSDVFWRVGDFRRAWEDFSPTFGPDSSWSAEKSDELELDLLGQSYLAGYTAARTGEDGVANDILAASRRRIVSATSTKDWSHSPPLYGTRHAMDVQRPALLANADAWDRIIAVASLLQSGKPRVAQDLLNGRNSYPATAALESLVGDLRAAVPTLEWRGVVASDPTRLEQMIRGVRADRIKRIGAVLFDVLPQPEDAKSFNRYRGESSVALRRDGFSDRQLPDDSTEITVNANMVSREIAGEMALLRAADLARRAGMDSFVIETRRDYGRYFRSGPRPSVAVAKAQFGYETVLAVRFKNASTTPLAIAADDIDAALHSVYAPTTVKAP